ncbi:MAG: hypothetical protein E6789_09545 [Clostridium baratii]|nr:hypothetical protein [Clostridium baratii]
MDSGIFLLVIILGVALNIAVLYYVISYIPNKLKKIEFKQRAYFEEIKTRLCILEDIIKENNKIKFSFIKPEKVLEPYEVFKKEYEILNFKDCEGKIAKESIIPYPPGIPLICAGEIITKDSINIIKEYLDNKKDVIGVNENKIKVIKNNFL